MPKGDFNVDEDYTSYDQNINNSNMNNINNLSGQGNIYGQTGDFSNQANFVDNSSVVFEEPNFESGSERLKYYFSTLNKTLLTLIGVIAAIVVAIIIVIAVVVARTNASYKSIVSFPSTVYVGETADINVLAKGKKELNKTTTTFKLYKYNLDDEYDYDNMELIRLQDAAKSSGIDNYEKLSASKLRDKLYKKVIDRHNLESKNIDNLTLGLSDAKLTGKDVTNTLIPIQEGRAIIEISSNLNNRKMAYLKKKITVCPSFNRDLIFGGKISVNKGGYFTPSINFGLGDCSSDVVYSSSNEDVFTISDEGEIYGVNVGDAILTVSKGSRSFSVPVYITKDFVAMSDVSFAPKQMQLVSGQTSRIKVSYKPFNASSENFRFTSSDSDVVSVDDFGVVTALKPGEVVIDCKSSFGFSFGKVSVVVSEGSSGGGADITDLKLDVKSLDIIEGASYRINAVVVPNDASDKTLTYSSSDSDILTVSDKGVILAKAAGNAIVTVTTKNKIQKSISVNVTVRKEPVVTASDKITSSKWHNKKFTLSIGGADSGSTYYYGKNENKITTKGSKIVIDKDTNTTYYVKACAFKVCSNAVRYVAMLDTIKPTINVALSGDDTATIALIDHGSMVAKVCVTDSDEYRECKWKDVEPSKNRTVRYTAKKNGTYYVFAKDIAGNISDGKIFNITGVE